MRRMSLLTALLLLSLAGPAAAQQTGEAPVMLGGKSLFWLSDTTMSSERRAGLVNDRLKRLVAAPEVPTVRVIKERRGYTLHTGKDILLIVAASDSDRYGIPAKDLAASWAELLNHEIEAARKPLSPVDSSPPPVPGASLGMLAALAAFGLTAWAFKASLGNLLAGLLLLVTRPFAPGDRIRIGEHDGEVGRGTPLHTRLRTLSNAEMLIPNARVLGLEIVNYSSARRGLLVSARIGVGYSVPHEMVEAMALEAAMRTPGVSDDPPMCWVVSFGEHAVSYDVGIKTDHPAQLDRIAMQWRQHLKDVFEENGTELVAPAPIASRMIRPKAIALWESVLRR